MHARRRCFRDFGYLTHRRAQFFGIGGQLLQGRRNSLNLFDDPMYRSLDLGKGFSDLVYRVKARAHRRGCILHGLDRQTAFLLDILDEFDDLFCRITRAFGQLSNFFRHHGKTSPAFPGSRRFDGRIERQEIRLLGDVCNHLYNSSNLAGSLAQAFDNRGQGINRFLNGVHLHTHMLDGLAPQFGQVGGFSRRCGYNPRVVGDLLHCIGHVVDSRAASIHRFHLFLGADGDLLCNLSHLFSRFRVLFCAGRKLFGGCRKLFRVDAPGWFRRYETKLVWEMRKLSRKKRFSRNWQKQKARIQRLHAHIANARRDFLHKTSTAISKTHAMVFVEELRIQKMSKSAKGTKENPGKNVRAKSGLNKAILDQGWFTFQTFLGYKLHWSGGWLGTVPAPYTSQTCPVPECGHVSQANRPTQSKFRCEQCRYEGNADTVGAMNILRAGLARIACSPV